MPVEVGMHIYTCINFNAMITAQYWGLLNKHDIQNRNVENTRAVV